MTFRSKSQLRSNYECHPCSTCGATPGKTCTSYTGLDEPCWPHAARIRACLDAEASPLGITRSIEARVEAHVRAAEWDARLGRRRSPEDHMYDYQVPLTLRLSKHDETITFIREDRFTQPIIKIGRLASSHIRLEDVGVSRMHAIIEAPNPDSVSIIDLSSTTGTFVNGQKINKARLRSGDAVTIGETRIEITIGDPAAAGVTRPTPSGS